MSYELERGIKYGPHHHQPSKYVQGNGALANIGNYVKALGAKPLILADAFVTKLVGDTVATSFHGAGIQPEFDCFNGECSRPEIDRLLARCKQTPFDVIIGIGGGKTLDTAKSVAFYQQVPVVIVPTIASTDAPPARWRSSTPRKGSSANT